MTDRDHTKRFNELLDDNFGLSGSGERSLEDMDVMAGVHEIRQTASRAHTRADNAIVRSVQNTNPYVKRLGISEDDLDTYVDQIEGLTEGELSELEASLGFNVTDLLARALDFREDGAARREHQQKAKEAAQRAADKANDFEANAQAAEDVERKVFAERYWQMDPVARRAEAARIGLDVEWKPPENTNAFGKPHDGNGW